MPPYNKFLGHLPVLVKVMSQIPKGAHGHYLPGVLRRMYPSLGPNFYLDTWPMNSPILFVADPFTLQQVTQDRSLPKHASLREFLRPISNGRDIVSLNGPEWKRWRSICNPGFSNTQIMSLTPFIVRATLAFCAVLEEYANTGKTLILKEPADKWALDVIGEVVLYVIRFSQKGAVS